MENSIDQNQFLEKCYKLLITLFLLTYNNKYINSGQNQSFPKQNGETQKISSIKRSHTQPKHNYTRWDKYPKESIHAEFCGNILKVQRNTPTNASRAELDRFPLIIAGKREC